MTDKFDPQPLIDRLEAKPMQITQSKVALYSAIAASDEYVIYYENRFLSMTTQDGIIRKRISWPNNRNHIIDICFYKENKFFLLTKNRFYMFNADNEQIHLLNTLDDEKDSSYHRCTSNGKYLILCFWGRKKVIEQWNYQSTRNRWKCKTKWESPLSCQQDEYICSLNLSKKYLGLIINNSNDESKLQLRKRQTMEISYSFQLSSQCSRFIPINNNNWLLVPYYNRRQEVLLINPRKKTVKPIHIFARSSLYEDIVDDKIIWNIALSVGNRRYIIVRCEKFVCYYDLPQNINKSLTS